MHVRAHRPFYRDSRMGLYLEPWAMITKLKTPIEGKKPFEFSYAAIWT